jgi:hypothetical protein
MAELFACSRKSELDIGTAMENLPQRDERLSLRRVEFVPPDGRYALAQIVARQTMHTHLRSPRTSTTTATSFGGGPSRKPSSQHDGIAAQSAMLYTSREGETRWTIKQWNKEMMSIS